MTISCFYILLIILTIYDFQHPLVNQVLSAAVAHMWFRFAGPMERYQAEVELIERENSTYLIRHRSKECTEYAISIK